ncbi:MAG: hypothetical protein AAB153_02245, partial [Pseudomonadota bacterium]
VLPLDLKTANGDDSRDGGRSGPSWPARGITPSLEGRGRTASGDGRDEGGRVASGTAAESNAGSSCRNSRRGVSGVPH